MDSAKYGVLEGVSKTYNMTFDYGFFIGAVICILLMILYKVYFWKDVDTTFHKKQEKKKTAE